MASLPGHLDSSKIDLDIQDRPLALATRVLAAEQKPMDNQPQLNPAVDLSPLAVRALMKGQKIEAIKIVREERGIDLMEAKELVEKYIRSDPAIQAELNNARLNSSGFAWILILIGLGILIWYFLAN